MTDQQRKQWIVWQIRKASYRYPMRSKAFAAARVSKGVYRCAHCNMKFGSKEIQLDHIIPVVDPEKGFIDWNDYIGRMFCDMQGLQVLCKPCHSDKTKDENKVRREKRAARKGKKQKDNK